MAFITEIIRSFRKMSTMRDLQLRVVSLEGNLHQEPMLTPTYLEAARRLEEAVEQYIEFCLTDHKVVGALRHYSLGKEDLRRIYKSLHISGVKVWVGGHYVPLSTITYEEPLLYFIQAERDGESLNKICDTLEKYWDGIIPVGSLDYKRVR